MKEFWSGVGIICGGAIGVAAALILLAALRIDVFSAWRDDGGEIEKLKQRIAELEPATK